MGLDYRSGIVYGTPVSDEVFARLEELSDEWLSEEGYLFYADEVSGKGGFLGVWWDVELLPGTYIQMNGEVIPAKAIDAFAAAIREYNVPTDNFGYYFVSQVW